MANRIVEQNKFVCSQVNGNHNKVWQYTLYDDGTVICEWGRVGKGMQTKVFSGGKRYADKKIREKIKKGYKKVEILGNSTSNSTIINQKELHDIASKQIKHSNPTVSNLIKYLTRVNAHNIYEATGGKITFNLDSGLFQTPIGLVSQNNITKARKILDIIAKSVNKRDFTSKNVINNFEEYLMLIPQEVPRKLTIENVLPDSNAILKQNDILDGLESSYAKAFNFKTEEGTEDKDIPQVFNVSLDFNEDSKVYNDIKKRFSKTKNVRHVCSHLNIDKIYDVEISTMITSFNNEGKKIGNIQKLWHGTRSANLLSILKSGFIIPPSNAPHCTGRLYGNGVYFSDQSTKSLNYAYGYWDRGQRDNNCFMFLCDVAMGKVYTPEYCQTKIPDGYDSFCAKAGKSGVLNNEMVVFKTSQINPLYLVEFKK